MVKQKCSHRSSSLLSKLHLAIMNHSTVDRALISMPQRERQGYRHMEAVASAKLTIAEDALASGRARTHGEALAQIILALNELQCGLDGTETGQPVELDQGTARITANCLWSAFSFLGGYDSQTFPAEVATHYAPLRLSPFAPASAKGGEA
jgi:hypothetical protein